MNYFVYILASKSRTINIGVTNNLERRILEHKSKINPGYTRKYNIDRLVYFEIFGDIRQAINREKQLKGWKRIKKIHLLEAINPTWEDLSKEWFS
jgi:putative endonuclease